MKVISKNKMIRLFYWAGVICICQVVIASDTIELRNISGEIPQFKATPATDRKHYLVWVIAKRDHGGEKFVSHLAKVYPSEEAATAAIDELERKLHPQNHEPSEVRFDPSTYSLNIITGAEIPKVDQIKELKLKLKKCEQENERLWMPAAINEEIKKQEEAVQFVETLTEAEKSGGSKRAGRAR